MTGPRAHLVSKNEGGVLGIARKSATGLPARRSFHSDLRSRSQVTWTLRAKTSWLETRWPQQVRSLSAARPGRTFTARAAANRPGESTWFRIQAACAKSPGVSAGCLRCLGRLPRWPGQLELVPLLESRLI